MRHNQLGFNNFKSFGERMQMFSDKPITLVYGPNSVGKSGFLHAQLLRSYMSQSDSIDLIQSDFAGDSLDLGGFKNFVNGKDSTKPICFEFEINNPTEISKIFGEEYIRAANNADNSLLDTQNLSLFEYHDVVLEEITYRLMNLKAKEDVYLLSEREKSAYAWSKQLLEIGTKSNDKEIVEETEAGILKLKNNFYEKHKDRLINTKRSHLEIFESALKNESSFYESVEREDGKKLDEVDRLLLFLMEKTSYFWSLMSLKREPEREKITCFQLINALYKFSFLKQIKTISVKFEYGFSQHGNSIFKKETQLKIYFSINHQVVFEALDVRYGNFQVTVSEYGKDLMANIAALDFKKRSLDSPISVNLSGLGGTGKFKKMLPEVFPVELLNPFKNISFLTCDKVDPYISDWLISVLSYLDDDYDTKQYFGPLRFYPERNDLTFTVSYVTEKDQGKIKDKKINTDGNEIEELIMMLKIKSVIYNGLPFLTDRIKKRIAIFAILLVYPRFLRKILSNSYKLPDMQDVLNRFRPKTFRRSMGLALKTETIWRKLILSDDLRDAVNHWLSDDSKLKSSYRLEIHDFENTGSVTRFLFNKRTEERKLRFIDLNNNVEVTPRDMGLGISQFLPILLTTKTLQKSKFYIEQPELHLHPAVQCEIADEFIRSMNVQKNRFYLETHSEHLLLRIMKRLRHSSEGKLKKDDDLYLTPDDVCLLYVDNNGEFTYLNELELDEDGSLLDPWPSGFFEEGLDERFA